MTDKKEKSKTTTYRFLTEQKSEKQKQRGDTDARKQRQLRPQACTAKNVDHKLLIIE